MSTKRWYVLDLNPIPWRVGPVSTGRKGDKIFGRVGPDAELQVYQNAVRETLEPEAVLTQGEIQLTMYFWRDMDSYTTHQARTHRTHQADLTNMQKALEDAIQGVLIENDKNVQCCTSIIMEQAHDIAPCVVICVEEWGTYTPLAYTIPDEIWTKIDAVRNPGTQPVQLELDNF